MQVPANVQQQVTAKLQAGLAIANKHYKLQLMMPTVSYSLRGRTAGKANYVDWSIKLNPVLLMENLQDFIDRTVPHELAHLVTDKVYPEAHQSGITFTRFGRIKRQKREVHGPRWQSVATVLGIQNVTRCHTYDTTRVAHRKARYQYRCAGCTEVLNLGPKLHKQLQRNPDSRWHKSCRGSRLVLVSMQPAQGPQVPLVPVAQPQGTRVPSPSATGATKLERARALFRANPGLGRQALIALFMRDLGMTKAGASTYVYTCQKAG